MNLGQTFFEYRSYTPIPFLVMMAIFAHPTIVSLIAGAAIVLSGEFLRLWGVSIAGSETRTTGPVGGTFLITTGPFAHVRNPLYVGNVMMYFGFGVMSMALFPWLALAALCFFMFQYSLIVSNEEKYLSERFGEEYQRYVQSVPRFFPSIRRYDGKAGEQPSLDWKRGLQSEKRTLEAVVLLSLVVCVLFFVKG